MNWLNRSRLFISYVVSCNGTSPSRVLFWIFVCLISFMSISAYVGNDPFDGAWYFLTMSYQTDPGNWILSLIAVLDALAGILLTAEFVSVCNNNRW